MQSEAVSPVRTFTIGFEDAAHDEAVHARAPERWDWLAARSGLGVSLAGDKVHKLAQGLAGARDLDGLYQSLVGEWKQPRELVRGATEAPTLLKRPEE